MSNKKTNEAKVSMTKIQKVLDFQQVAPTTIKFETNDKDEFIEVSIKHSIDKDDKAKFILEVVNSCFIDNAYIPIYRDETLDIAIIEYFTNIKVDTTERNLINIVVNSDIVEQVKQHINSKQLESISCAIEAMIDYRKDEILSNSENLLNQTLGKLQAFTDSCSGLDEFFNSEQAKDILLTSAKMSKLDESQVIKTILDKNNNTSELSVY